MIIAISEIIRRKIEQYQIKGGLDQTIKIFLALGSIRHLPVVEHMERVALLAEETAIRTGKDPKASFIGAVVHDFAKFIFPHDLFEGREINDEEYAEIKKHPLAGFEILKEFHGFTALCAGLHHATYKPGYGISLKDFPPEYGMDDVKKVIETSTIISICDFIDAYTHRKTSIRGKFDEKTTDLKELLKKQYPSDILTIEAALQAQKELGI